jgi:hypothetical protein
MANISRIDAYRARIQDANTILQYDRQTDKLRVWPWCVAWFRMVRGRSLTISKGQLQTKPASSRVQYKITASPIVWKGHAACAP